MTLPLGKFTSIVRQFPSRRELLEFLPVAGTPYWILDQNIEAPREFFCLELWSTTVIANIGIFSFGIGIKPAACIITDRAFIGFNKSLSIVELSSLSTPKPVDLYSLFLEFIPIPNTKNVCIICESAISVYCLNGIELWRRDTQLIENYKFLSPMLEIDFDDGTAASIDLVQLERNA